MSTTLTRRAQTLPLEVEEQVDGMVMDRPQRVLSFASEDDRPRGARNDSDRTLIGDLEKADTFNTIRSRKRDRFLGKGREVTWGESAKAIVISSWLNLLLIVLPVAWAFHYVNANAIKAGKKTLVPEEVIFALCFVGIIPMKKIFDFGGEQLSLYLGKDLGDLAVVTLDNIVEATLAIILLIKCEIRLLQATLAGVVLLHLLLVPGMAFFTDGARIWEQDLQAHLTQLNSTLLTVGVFSLLIPAVFWSAMGRGMSGATVISDETKHTFLMMSRGMAVILICVYIASRIYLYNPPGEDNALRPHPKAPEEIKRKEEELLTTMPDVNIWACLILLAITIGLTAFTSEFLVDSIDSVRAAGNIREEWFGLILLPLVSFSADALLAVAHFVHYLSKAFFGTPMPPETLAKALEIDLSIQFTMFWMPFMVLLGWWLGHPLTLLFDLFEVAFLVCACFLVNYVTSDAKTNWLEGFAMTAFYTMIALCAWFYPGQPDIAQMVQCGSVSALAS